MQHSIGGVARRPQHGVLKFSSNCDSYDWMVPDLSVGAHVAPMRLAGLHSIKHESVRHWKRAVFQEMSNRYDRSSLAPYYFEDSQQRLTRASRLTGKNEICIQGHCTQTTSAAVHKHHMLQRSRGNKVQVTKSGKMKQGAAGQEGVRFFKGTLTPCRGRGHSEGPAMPAKALIRNLITLV